MRMRRAECPAPLREIGADKSDAIGKRTGDERTHPGACDEDVAERKKQHGSHAPDDQEADDAMIKQAVQRSTYAAAASGWRRPFTGISKTPSRKAEKNACNPMTTRVSPSTMMRGNSELSSGPKSIRAQRRTA